MNDFSTPCVLACVTGQKDCERHIMEAKRLADEMGFRLEVLNVQPAIDAFTPPAEELQYLFDVAKENGAGITVYYNNEAPLIAACHIHTAKAAAIVTGTPGEWSSDFVKIVHFIVPEIEIRMIDKSGVVHVLQPVGAGKHI